MFLERKFSHPIEGPLKFDPTLCPVMPHAEWSAMPECIYDVVCNIQLLLKARRNYDHIFSNFGLSPSEGQSGREGQVERLQTEVPETLARYERRFQLAELDFDVDDAGVAFMKAEGRVTGVSGTLTFRFGVTNRKIIQVEFVADGT